MPDLYDHTSDLTPFSGVPIREFAMNGSSIDLNVDGSVTPVDFTVEAPSGKIWYIHRVTILIEDIGTSFARFGGITSLTNGVDFKISQNGLSEELLGNIKKNSEFYLFSKNIISESSTTDLLVIHIDIKELSGSVFILNETLNDIFTVTINDNLTGLNTFRVLLNGYEVNA